MAERRRDVVRIGYFGLYARSDWGAGSELDLVVIVTGTQQRFEQRAIEWDMTGLPVPADLLIYTQSEWDRLSGRIAETLLRETVWVHAREKTT